MLGEVPWGTHLCQFYKTADDHIDVLVPYFKAGLEDGEYCMWVTSDPLTVEAATAAMREAVPGFDRMVAEGRMEILPYKDWYLKDGCFDLKRVFEGWIDRLEAAQARGLAGLRTSGNTAWLEETDWDDFTEYEEALDEAIGDYHLMAICTYSLDKCGASEVIDVVNNHRYALIKREGKWTLIESTERRKAEAEFRTIVRASMDGFWVTNMEGRFLDVNDAYCRLIGYDRDELLRMDISQVEALESGSDIRQRIEKIRVTGHDRFETKHVRKDGAEVYVDVSVNYLDTGGGRMFVFVRDITESKNAEKELLRANAELDGYAHAVSHDLRSPLSAVNLACSMMKDAQQDGTPEEIAAEAEHFVDSIQLNLHRCYSLIDDLLTLAEAGQRPKATEPVAVSEVVTRVLAELAGDIADRGVEVRADEDLGTVEASPTHIYQLFSNLVGNAIRHNDSPHPVVEISFMGTDESGGVRYRVKDNGSGIPEEDFDNLFMPFFKRGKGSDTGIGLATVEKIVKVYAGDVRASNDGGACFDIVLRSLAD